MICSRFSSPLITRSQVSRNMYTRLAATVGCRRWARLRLISACRATPGLRTDARRVEVRQRRNLLAKGFSELAVQALRAGSAALAAGPIGAPGDRP